MSSAPVTEVGRVVWSWRESTPAAAVMSDVDGNSLALNDWTYFQMLDRMIQKEPHSSVDPYMNGMLATLGVKKGVAFEAEKEMLTRAAQTG